MLSYCQLDSKEYVSVKFHYKVKSFHWRKCICLCLIVLTQWGRNKTVDFFLYNWMKMFQLLPKFHFIEMHAGVGGGGGGGGWVGGGGGGGNWPKLNIGWGNGWMPSETWNLGMYFILCESIYARPQHCQLGSRGGDISTYSISMK